MLDHKARPAAGLLRLKEIVGPDGLLRISKSTFYAGIRAGLYPRPVRISKRSVGWRKYEILPLAEHGIPNEGDAV